jgi:hypothetical protein
MSFIKKIFVAAIIIVIVASVGYTQGFLGSNFTWEENSVSQVTPVKGEVFLNDQLIKSTQIIKQGDKIKTAAQAQAIIEFADDSVSRLSSNSEVLINTLSFDSETLGSQIQVKVLLGEVWSKIIKLISASNSFEVTSETTVAAVRGSAFNFKVNSAGLAEITTVEHSLWLKTIDPQTKKIRSKHTVTEGKQVAVNQELKIRDAKKLIKNNQWFKNNHVNDVKHKQKVEKKIKEKRIKKAGVLPGSPLYLLKNLRDKSLLAKTKTEDERLALEINIAQRKLVEAQVLIDNDKADKAQENLKIYTQVLNKARKNSNQEIHKKLKKAVAVQKQLLKTATVGTPLYKIRQEVETMELSLARTTQEKDSLRKRQIERKIIEINDAVKAGKALQVEEDLKDVIRKIKYRPIQKELEKEAGINDYIKQIEKGIKIEQKKLLQNSELKKKLTDLKTPVKTDTIKKKEVIKKDTAKEKDSKNLNTKNKKKIDLDGIADLYQNILNPNYKKYKSLTGETDAEKTVEKMYGDKLKEQSEIMKKLRKGEIDFKKEIEKELTEDSDEDIEASKKEYERAKKQIKNLTETSNLNQP